VRPIDFAFVMSDVGMRRGPLAVEIGLGLIAAGLAALGVYGIIWGTDFWLLDPVAAGLGPVWAAAMIALALAGYLVQQRWPTRSRWAIALLAGIAVGVVMAPLVAGLHGTPQPPFSVLRGDMTFRTEYITRFAATWHLRDYTFGGLNAFYPPAWFWLAGRAAHYLDVEPWRIVKPFTIGTVGVALGLAYVLWRRVLTPAGALAAAIGSSLVLTHQNGSLGQAGHATQGWYSPYSCLVAVTGVAWLAAVLTATREGGSRRGWTFLVAVGALLALSYYLLFVILAVVLLVLALAPAGERWTGLRRAGGVLAGVGALTAVFWVPLVSSVLNGAASQGHYLAPDFLEVSVAFNGPTELVVLAVAVVAALALARHWPAAQAVMALLVATVVYQLLSVVSLVFTENQLQPHRAVTMMWATLGAAVPVALEGFTRTGTPARSLPTATLRTVAGAIAVVAVATTFVLGARQGTDLATGPLTIGAHDPVDLETPREMNRFITATTGRRPQDLTLLGGANALLVTRPYNGFLSLSARYAHPEARLPQRVRAVENAAECPDARCTTRALTHTGFGRIDAIVMTRTPVGIELHTQLDAFPLPRLVTISFPAGHLARRVWAQRRYGESVVYARRRSPSPVPASAAPRASDHNAPAPARCHDQSTRLASGKTTTAGASGRRRPRHAAAPAVAKRARTSRAPGRPSSTAASSGRSCP